MNYAQLKQYIVEPALHRVALYSAGAVQLLVLTTVVESGAGQYLHQLGTGPALGIYQMEPATHDDCWTNFLRYRATLAGRIKAISVNHTAPELMWNLWYATAMARVKYLRATEPLPPANDALALAKYYKTHYNTSEGASQVNSSVRAYQDYIGAT